jgi:hypothetical protein
MKKLLALLFAVLGVCACVPTATPTPLPPTPDARATETEIARRIFATQTASVPTPTRTNTPTLTPVGTPTQTSTPTRALSPTRTLTPTRTPIPSATPKPSATPIPTCSAPPETDTSESIMAWIKAKHFVTDNLEAPATAKFDDCTLQICVTPLGMNRYSVSSYVDAQNSYGALIRTRWVAVVRQDCDMWYLESLKFQ